MRTMSKIRKVRLKLNQSDEPVILGIVSAEPDYKLSLALNKNLGISLKNSSPVIPDELHGDEQNFSRFSYTSLSGALTCDLTSNRSGKNLLVSKLKNIDYFFHISDPDNELDMDRIISQIRETDCVTAVFSISTGSIKDKNLHHLIR